MYLLYRVFHKIFAEHIDFPQFINNWGEHFLQLLFFLLLFCSNNFFDKSRQNATLFGITLLVNDFCVKQFCFTLHIHFLAFSFSQNCGKHFLVFFYFLKLWKTFFLIFYFSKKCGKCFPNFSFSDFIFYLVQKYGKICFQNLHILILVFFLYIL